jgi:hypothetical protein
MKEDDAADLKLIIGTRDQGPGTSAGSKGHLRLSAVWCVYLRRYGLLPHYPSAISMAFMNFAFSEVFLSSDTLYPTPSGKSQGFISSNGSQL